MSLFKAIENNDINLVKERLDQINITDEFGITALMYACAEGHIDIVELLLEKVNDDYIMIHNHFGSTALMLICRYRDGFKIVKSILARVDNKHIMHQDIFGNTALMYARNHDNTDVVKLLLDNIVEPYIDECIKIK